MKRILRAFMVAAVVFAYSLPAFAADEVDVKVKGSWDFAFGWSQNRSFGNDDLLAKKRGTRANDNGIAGQRIRTQINFIASENLQGVLHFEIGDLHWGNGGSEGRGSGAARGTDGVNIETKHAYLDWMVPSSSLHIRMGLQGLALPTAVMGNPVLNDDVAALVANYKMNDTLSATLFWARPYNKYINDSESGAKRSISDEMDMIGLVTPLSFDGVVISPWAMWAKVGSASGLYSELSGIKEERFTYQDDDSTSAWWGGLSVDVSLYDPLTFGLDAVYGYIGKNYMQVKEITLYNQASPATNGVTQNNTLGGDVSGRGWYIAATLDYKLDWGTPGIFGWYASGDDYGDIKDGKFGRLPVLPTCNGLYRTTFSQDGAFGLDDSWVLNGKGVGTWGLGVQVTDVSFIEDLSHTLRLVYHHGTNDDKIIKNGLHDAVNWGYVGQYMTDKDHAFEVNFDHIYQIHDNLTAALALGWINLDLDKSTWKHTSLDGKSGHKTDDAWKAEVAFKYSF